MGQVAPGGPSTINGVLYQMLWSLMTLGGFRVVENRLVAGSFETVTLVLEPQAGGDQEAKVGSKRIVTQIKSRSTGDSWSLQDIVREVLPDLYSAVELAGAHSEYHFVTEGGMGKWNEVEAMFRSLPPPPNGPNPLSHLSDTVEVRFGRQIRRGVTGQASFWEAGPYTPRRLVRKIVDTIRLQKTADAGESDEQTCLKVWHLLRGFRFHGFLEHQLILDRFDQWLLGRIGYADRLREKRDSLLLDLGRRACSCAGPIKARDFFHDHELNADSLIEWFELSQKSRQHLQAVLLRSRVDLSEEVRPRLVSNLFRDWRSDSPLLVLTGESGSGKSFLGCGLLNAAASAGDVSILVDARGNVDHDLDAAAKCFWNEIAGRDEAPPFSRLRARLQHLDPGHERFRLALMIDNVVDFEEARQLIGQDWEGWGVRFVLTCTAQVADAVKELVGKRGRIVEVSSFSSMELESYIRNELEINAAAIPFDVFKVLRRPLLARLFRDCIPASGWQPRNEYELFELAWKRLRQRGVSLLDLDSIRQMAAEVFLSQSAYPWTPSALRAFSLSPTAVESLVRHGLLHETADGCFEIWHDRLLNWAVADGVAHELRHAPERVEDLCQRVAALMSEPRVACGRSLSYVPMDVLWNLADPTCSNSHLSNRIVFACERALNRRAPEILFQELLPTLGDRGVPFLFERLRSSAVTGPGYSLAPLVEGLAGVLERDDSTHTRSLLNDPLPRVQRAGVRLMAHLGSGANLDQLWSIHRSGVQNPKPFLWEHEKDWSLYDDTFGALKANVRVRPEWLYGAIQQADPATDPVYDLAYLVALSGEPSLWVRNKTNLMAKVDRGHERSIASCIRLFHDSGEIDWLISRLQVEDDMLGAASLHALAVIDPDRGLDSLETLSESHRYLSRDWAFAELVRRRPERTMSYFALRLREHDNPWQFLQVLQNREDLIDPSTLDYLLYEWGERLNGELDVKSAHEASKSCVFECRFVNALCSPSLLDRLRQRRGTRLEAALSRWLIEIGPQSGVYREYDKHEGLKALGKIGGEGYSRVINDWLARGDWYARVHAVQLARRRADLQTIELLTKLSQSSSEEGDHAPGLLPGYAAAALAVHCCWEPVFLYYLRVGLQCLNMVDECASEHETPCSDELLAPALSELRALECTKAGAMLAVGLSGRRDLLPLIREVLHRTDLLSETAATGLLAFQWLRDHEPESVPLITRYLRSHNFHAVNALSANGSAAAHEALLEEAKRSADFEVATYLTKFPAQRTAALDMIRRSFDSRDRVGRRSLTLLAARLCSGDMTELAEDPEIYSLCEDVAFLPTGGWHVSGEPPAALRFIGQRQPEYAIQVAAARIQDPDVKDVEDYVRLVVELAPDRAIGILLNAALTQLPARSLRVIGVQLRSLDAVPEVLSWITGDSHSHCVGACGIAGYLDPAPELIQALLDRTGDYRSDIRDRAIQSYERLRQAEIVNSLIEQLNHESDLVHRWVLLDAIVASADGTRISWLHAIQEKLIPAMTKFLEKALEDRRKKLMDELNRLDSRR